MTVSNRRRQPQGEATDAMSTDYASGSWFVSAGREDEFIARWTEFPGWTRESAPGLLSARLIQDAADSRPRRPSPALSPRSTRAFTADVAYPRYESVGCCRHARTAKELYGIAIYMYWNEGDHPVAHFHAHHGGKRASVSIDGQVLAGGLESRALEFVLDWARLHRDGLLANWERARRLEPLTPIPPLP
jgi:uncharacterized protein DUF4160